MPEYSIPLESEGKLGVRCTLTTTRGAQRSKKKQEQKAKRKELASSNTQAAAIPIVLNARVQRHIVYDADIGEGEEHFRSPARELAVAQNVAMNLRKMSQKLTDGRA